MENSSMLPQPTARPGSMHRALMDVSDSDHNARNAMAPPHGGSLKRQASQLPEPAPKRKTLVERAGEPIKHSQTFSKSTSSTGHYGMSGSTFSAYRAPSTASTQSSRSNSGHLRATSTSSVAASAGSSLRPPSSHANFGAGRPKTSLAKEKGNSVYSRPETAQGIHSRSHEIHKDKQNFDPDMPYQDFKRMFEDYKHMYQDSMSRVQEARDETNIFKETMSKLEQERTSQTENIINLTSENETLKFRIQSAEKLVAEQRRENEIAIDDLRRNHRADSEALRQENRRELEQLKDDQRNEVRELKHKHEEELAAERGQRIEALSQVSTQGALEKQRHQMDLDMKDQELKNTLAEAGRITASLDREKQLNDDLRKDLAIARDNSTSLDTTLQALQAKIAYLESDSKSQSEAYADMEQKMNEAIAKADECEEKLRKEETLRRKLHNQVQELKGNIRVFCRVRPTLSSEEELARMKYPDPEESTDIEVKGMEETSSLGKVTTKTYPFSFDRVFDPTANNSAVFDEISQLIQSALDGFNVCIFAYGQTGSGKTYTMSSEDGMIPQALRQIYSTSKELESRGWKYSMEGSFVEVYNEDIRDLLGDDDKGNKKHEIRHDMVKCETTITDVTTLMLDSQDQVESILSQAMARRSVAATNANERSSRSHSVFILKLVGENSITGERSKGTLNLVDLAGSERLNNSKVEGQRLKETQSINKSLSCLGDVIGALGQQQGAPGANFDGRVSVNAAGGAGTAHIPYRNSKLTYLLQFSLGGNSKTLMFVMVAPEKKCLGETITSLKFAEKVSRTKVGVAKKVK